MKKLLFIVFISFSISYAQSQTMDCQFNNNSRWKYFENYWSGQTGIYNSIDYEYFICGDTTIASNPYQKLVKNARHTIIDFNVPPNDTNVIYSQNEYIGAIREIDNTITFIYKDSIIEYELYNFNLAIGDTILTEVHKGEVVHNIDTLDGGRKRFEIDSDGLNYNVYIIEGIGSNVDLLNPITWGIGCDVIQKINCFKYGDTVIYEEEDFYCGRSCSDNILNSINVDNLSIESQLYPNPTNGILFFKPAYYEIITIMNIFGKTVYEFKNNATINLKNLPSGIYYCAINTGNKKFINKIIKY